MLPEFWETKALSLYPKKVWIAVATVAGILMFAGSGYLLPAKFARLTVALSFAIVTISWALFLICYWFDPSRGSLSYGRWLGRHLPPVHAAMRWWSAILLVLFVVFGIFGPIWWVVSGRAA